MWSNVGRPAGEDTALPAEGPHVAGSQHTFSLSPMASSRRHLAGSPRTIHKARLKMSALPDLILCVKPSIYLKIQDDRNVNVQPKRLLDLPQEPLPAITPKGYTYVKTIALRLGWSWASRNY